MARGYVVNEPFTRNGTPYRKGQIINDLAEVASLEGCDQEHHLIKTQVPDPVPAAEPVEHFAEEHEEN